MKLAVQLSTVFYSALSLPLTSKYSTRHSVLALNLPISEWQTRFHTHAKTGYITVLYILIFKFLDMKQEGTILRSER